MPDEANPIAPNSPNQKKPPLSGPAKLGIGCAIVSLVGIIAIGIALFSAVKLGKRYLNEITKEYRDMGFENTVQGQKITINNDLDQPTLLVGQLVQVYGTCSTNLAVVAQVAEIHGTVKGKLYFKGQVLRIQPSAVIENGADIAAQSFVNDGIIRGELKQGTPLSLTPSSD